MKKLTPITFSLLICIVITLFFSILTVWIYYRYSWKSSDAKDALSIAASYFGAVATLGAALIAAYLYSDWKQPIFISKIALEQKEIISITRRMKRHIDTLMYFTESKENTGPPSLSDEYQKLVNTILDDIDDLAGLLKAYNFNFKNEIKSENTHLEDMTDIKEALLLIYDTLAKPDPIIDFINSYNKVKTEIRTEGFKTSVYKILVTLPDKLSKYHSHLIK